MEEAKKVLNAKEIKTLLQILSRQNKKAKRHYKRLKNFQTI